MKLYKFDGRHNISGERIRMARQDMRISQAQLAARAQTEGVMLEQDAISNIERGERLLRISGNIVK